MKNTEQNPQPHEERQPPERPAFDFDYFLNEQPPAAGTPGAPLDFVRENPPEEDDGPEMGPQTETDASVLPPDDPALAAPPRPEILVAEPRPRVVITPEDDYDEEDPPARRRSSGGVWKGVAGVVAALAVIGLIVFLLSGVLDTLRGGEPGASASPTPLPTLRPADVLVPATATPAASEPQETRHVVTVTAGSGGSVSPNGSVYVGEGGSVSFTITPDSGYAVAQVLVDGVDQGAIGSYSFSGVAGDHSLYVVFVMAPEATPEPTAAPTPEPTAEPTAVPTPEPTAVAQPDSETDTALPAGDGEAPQT